VTKNSAVIAFVILGVILHFGAEAWIAQSYTCLLGLKG